MSLRFAPDRLALLLALVPYLDEVGVVSVTEAAEHFHVEAEDIRAAVNLIAASGVPTVDHVPLDNDMFDIDWDAFLDDDVIVLTRTVVIEETPRFSRGETSALIAGLQYLSSLPGSADNDVLHSVQRKLAAAGGVAALVAAPGATESARTEVARALAEHRQLTFVYATPDGRSEPRRIDVVQVESENDVWFVRGWCHDRDAMRVFRLDRMTEVESTDVPATVDLTKVEIPETLFAEGSDDFNVTVEVSRAGIALLGEYVRSVVIPKTGDPVTLTVRVAHVHGLKRVVASHPDHIRVIAPPSAVEAVRDWAAMALAQEDAPLSQ